jgi:alanine-synthesizing transaminase
MQTIKIHPSEKAKNVKYAIRNIVRFAKEVEKKGKEILYLNIGDPTKYDFDVPRHMKDAVTNGMLNGFNGYTPSVGIDEARIAAAKDAVAQGFKHVTYEDIIITNGASEGIELALTALLNPGDNVLTPAPGYPLYTAVLGKLGMEENPYYLDEENSWQPDPVDIKRKVNKNTKALVLINPNNPTGSVCSMDLLKEIMEIAEKNNLVIFADEIYNKLTYEKEHIPIGTLTNDIPIITFNGLSKCYLAPGWRMGWMIFNNRKIFGEFMTCLNNLLEARLCSPSPQQYAVKAALEGPQDHIKVFMDKLRVRREITQKRINAIEGLSCVEPDGAFYSMPRIDAKKVTSDWDFVLKLVEETGVLFVPGEGFGQKPGTRHFRIVFLPDENTLNRAYDKLADFMKKYI